MFWRSKGVCKIAESRNAPSPNVNRADRAMVLRGFCIVYHFDKCWHLSDEDEECELQRLVERKLPHMILGTVRVFKCWCKSQDACACLHWGRCAD